MLAQRRSVGLRSGVLVGVLAACALTMLPAAPASAASGDFSDFRPFTLPDGPTRGENGWYLRPGTITYYGPAREVRTWSETKFSIFGEPVATVYYTHTRGVSACLVNGQAPLVIPEEDGGVAAWRIPVPASLAPGDFVDGRYTVEGIYEVECTVTTVLREQTQWIGFIPGEAETTRWEVVDRATVKIDSTPPSVSAVPREPASLDPQNTNWHRAATGVYFVGTDNGSGVASCSDPVVIGGPAGSADKTAVGSCRNGAGVVTEVSYVYRFDDEAPASDATLPPSRNGWHRGDTEVAWNWSDPHSGVKPDACPATSTTSGEGTAVTVHATCSDWAGNQQSASQTLKVDATPPEIILANRPQPNAAGWHNEDVRIDWLCSDDLAGAEAETISRTAATEGEAVSVTGVCSDFAGNESRDTQSDIKLDKTPPAAQPLLTGREGSAGWYLSPVSVAWQWSDALSGIDDDRCRSEDATQGEGAGQKLEAECADVAENVGTASWTFDVDLADPEIVATVDRAPGSTGWYTAPVTIHYECDDPGAGSGLADGACPQDVTVAEEGLTTITRSVTDRAGREGVVSTSVKVDLNDPTIAASPDRAPDVDAWYTSPVTVAFTCGDPPPGSGIAHCPAPATVADEGDLTVVGQARDHAGRLSTVAATEVRVDLQPPDATIARRGADTQAGGDGLQLRDSLGGSATDAVSGVGQVVVRWTHPSRGAESVIADLHCTDATRRVCTWSAKVPLGQPFDAVVVATDRVGREDPTPASPR